MAARHTFRLEVLGTYRARIPGNEDHVTASLVAGDDDRLIYSGTITMSSPQFESFVSALRRGLPDGDLEVVDGHGQVPRPA